MKRSAPATIARPAQPMFEHDGRGVIGAILTVPLLLVPSTHSPRPHLSRTHRSRGGFDRAKYRLDKATLDQVVVVGQHISAPAEVPLETTSPKVRSRRYIRALSAGPTVTAQTLLNSQPSIIAFTDGPLGTRSTVYLRSFNGRPFAETYDGIALNDLFNGT